MVSCICKMLLGECTYGLSLWKEVCYLVHLCVESLVFVLKNIGLYCQEI